MRPDTLRRSVDAMLRAGVAAVQYRRKRFSDETEAADLLALCRSHRVPFIVNDDPELARRIGADGVHVGVGDADIATARRAVGAHGIVGVSCYGELPRAVCASAEGADYVAFGSFFESRTKPDAKRADPGLLRRARAELTIPIVAIGGITRENAAVLLRNGADWLALSAGLFDAAAPAEAVADLAALFAVEA
jgi:thiamine-phosphate pyrophosphorylase